VEREYVIVESLDGPADLARPGAVQLRTPVAYRHPATAGSAQRVTAGGPGPSTALTRDALPEDRVAFAADPGVLASDQTVLIDDADPRPPEYVVVRLPQAATDANGYYLLGPVGRVSTVKVSVTPPGADSTHIVVYDETDNIVNLRV